MAAAGSVSHWLDRLQAGDHAPAQPLWEVYFQRLVALARAKLQGVPRQAADEEDVALSAFNSFCRGAAAGRFPQLADRADLWRLLVTITGHKALDRLRHERRLKRRPRPAEEVRFEEVVGPEPTPAFAAQVAEECRRLLGLLGDAELEAVAVWKMEGYSTAEIADLLGCVPRTVERKLRLIRQVWEKEGQP
jgi:DNA-directed RNA polymerase specialized sigma24 family protein